jgi:outer membrane protein TolC
MKTKNKVRAFSLLVFMIIAAVSAMAQQGPGASGLPPGTLSLRQAVAQALGSSREITLARLQYEAAQKQTAVVRSQFMPNLYAGSGAAYTTGFPLAAGGGAPALFSVSYNQSIFDALAGSDVSVAQQKEEQLRLAFEGARENVILRVASGYLELAKVRRSRDLLVRERDSASRILDYTRQRANEGLELPIEITRAQLTAARIEQSIAKLDNADETLSDQLRNDLGLAADAPVQVAPQDLPAPEGSDSDLLQSALRNSVVIKTAASERESSLARLKGEKGSRWPSFAVTGQYNMLAKFNNYDVFFNKFQRNNFIAGVSIRIPIFSARAFSGIASAQANFAASDAALQSRRNEVSMDARQKSRQDREASAAHEVARLELQLAQQNTETIQAQFNEGRASLRDLETAQLQQNDKFIAFLDADFAVQQAQLQIMRASGQLPQLAQ